MAEYNFFMNEDDVWDKFVVSDSIDYCFENDKEQRVDDSDIGVVVVQSSLDTINKLDDSNRIQVDDGDISAVVNYSLRPPMEDCANLSHLEFMERSSLLSQPPPVKQLQESIPLYHGHQSHDASTAGCLHEATSLQQLHNVMNTCMKRSSLLSWPPPIDQLQESIPLCHGQHSHGASTAGCLHEATSIQQLHNVMNTMDVGIRWHISRNLYRWAGSTIPSSYYCKLLCSSRVDYIKSAYWYPTNQVLDPGTASLRRRGLGHLRYFLSQDCTPSHSTFSTEDLELNVKIGPDDDKAKL